MPVPSTSGNLVTTITNMKVGDYIPCKYVASSGAVGTFSELGTSVATEIPVTGSATPNGLFYFVKDAKGILVADRVVQHSIPWDTLNTGKVIQGKPIDFGNIISAMTSNTMPTGVASASSKYDATYDAWKAFNNTIINNTDAWITTNGLLTGWLRYDFSVEKKIAGYSIYSRNDTGTQDSAPKNWTFEASNTGQFTGEQVILDSQSNITGWTAGTKRTFVNKNNINSYRFYRINVSANNGNVSYLAIGELEFHDIIGDIRSLTGGVAYADANGNSSLTVDSSLGCFPTNNEYNKYIMGFPANKIQAGKTYIDVFNTNGLWTWTRDTPAIGFNTGTASITTSRMIRGNDNYTTANQRGEHWLISSTSNTTVGFRPVFSFIE